MNQFKCGSSRRRIMVRTHDRLNGIDFVELDEQALELRLRFLNANGLAVLRKDDLHIRGGGLGHEIAIVELTIEDEKTLLATLDRLGGFSSYQLAIQAEASAIDPRLNTVNFQFRLDCPDDNCGEPLQQQAFNELDKNSHYLAKDYASFRRLLIDQLATKMPGWQDRNPADPAIALIELLAYAGDYLSYQQDAVATEAYLDTARRRTSLRRHAHLVDYHVHEGRSARTWVQIQVSADGVEIPAGSMVFSRLGDQFGATIGSDSAKLGMALSQTPQVFETIAPITLYQAHNEMSLYAWGEREARLPVGATSATLVGHYPSLAPGNVLILQEQIGPRTGESVDADLTRRHAVRLTRVRADVDPLGGRLVNLDEDALDITHIEWHPDDAPPFSFCLATETDSAHQRRQLPDVTVALGNLVAADHGRTIKNEPLDIVPNPTPALARLPRPTPHGESTERVAAPPRFRPRLARGPLTRVAPYDDQAPANRLLTEPAACTPALTVNSYQPAAGLTLTWSPQRDLLDSGPTATDVVAETENDGAVYLRFGDNQFGRRPVSGDALQATYRVGNGAAGNIGANALAHLVTESQDVLAVTNPLPAMGGVDPESAIEIRRRAPYAFRRQLRAVTPADYAEMAATHPEVQRVAATRRWTGSWHTIFLAVDRTGGRPIDAAFRDELRGWLDPWRMAGHDIEVRPPQFVPLDIVFTVCLQTDALPNQVERRLRRVLGSRHPDGFFHPDHWSFGQALFLSQFMAQATSVAGVASIQLTRCRRLDQTTPPLPADSRLNCGPLEILRLDDNRNLPANGILTISWEGGAA